MPAYQAASCPTSAAPGIRPEETTGACLEDDLPAPFGRCEPNGRVILKVLDGKTHAGARVPPAP